MRTLMQLLLIEDDDIDAMSVKRVMDDIDFVDSMIHFTNGEDALAYLRSTVNGLPSLILLDLNMPRMNGFEFLEEIKKDKRLCRVPVIVLTTSQADRDIAEAFTHCIAGYLVKPVSYAEFSNLIDVVCKYWSLNKLPN